MKWLIIKINFLISKSSLNYDRVDKPAVNRDELQIFSFIHEQLMVSAIA